MTFQVDSRVFIKGVGVKGIVKTVKGNKYGVTYIMDGKRKWREFDEKRLEKWRGGKKGNKKVENTKPLQIKIKYHDPNMPKLEKIVQGDWIDLRVTEDIELKAGEYKLISLGIGMKLPKGYEVVIVPRSSTFKTWGVLQTNSFGVVDNSYSGNDDIYHFPAYATRDTKIEKYSRICQFRIQRIMPKVEFAEVENLDEKSRGGFGSTGTK